MPSNTLTAIPSLATSTAIAPVASSSPWLFPPALNQTFVTNFAANITPPDRTITFENGTTFQFPPDVFNLGGVRPDIILDSLEHLTYNERVETSPNSQNTTFGLGHKSVRSGDTIALDWEGEDEKVVAMTCHECIRYNGEQNMFKACESFTENFVSPIAFRIGYLSTEPYVMSQRFRTTGYLFTTISRFETEHKIPRNVPIEIPRLQIEGSPRSAAACILTLDYDRWSLNTRFSIPFAVYSEPRRIGVSDPPSVVEKWAFNSTHPDGVCVGDCWTPLNRAPSGLSSDGGDEPEKKNNIGTVAAGVVGGIIGLVVVLYLLDKCRRIEKIPSYAAQTAAMPSAQAALPVQERRSAEVRRAEMRAEINRAPIAEYYNERPAAVGIAPPGNERRLGTSLDGRRSVDSGPRIVDDGQPPPTYEEVINNRV